MFKCKNNNDFFVPWIFVIAITCIVTILIYTLPDCNNDIKHQLLQHQHRQQHQHREKCANQSHLQQQRRQRQNQHVIQSIIAQRRTSSSKNNDGNKVSQVKNVFNSSRNGFIQTVNLPANYNCILADLAACMLTIICLKFSTVLIGYVERTIKIFSTLWQYLLSILFKPSSSSIRRIEGAKANYNNNNKNSMYMSSSAAHQHDQQQQQQQAQAQQQPQYMECKENYPVIALTLSSWRAEYVSIKQTNNNNGGSNSNSSNNRRTNCIQIRQQSNTFCSYYLLLMFAQQPQKVQAPQKNLKGVDLARMHSATTTPPSGSKCYYNCTCYCCTNGCCVISSSCSFCCCCCSNSICDSNGYYGCHLSMSKCYGASQSVLNRSVFINIAQLASNAARRVLSLLQQLQKLLCRGILHCSWTSTKNQHNPLIKLANRRSSLGTSTASTLTSSDGSVQKTQYGQITYDIANDQQLKTNNLCKIFCNNRKRQRRRRRKRRRRRRPCSGSGSGTKSNDNKQQQQQQNSPLQLQLELHRKQSFLLNRHQPHLFSLKAFKAIINQATLLSGAPLQSSPATITTTTTTRRTPESSTRSIPSSLSSSSQLQLRNPYSMRLSPRSKRTRTNFVLLLIGGLFWFESPKLINGSAIGNLHVQQLASRDYNSVVLRTPAALEATTATNPFEFGSKSNHNINPKSEPVDTLDLNIPNTNDLCINATMKNYTEFLAQSVKIRSVGETAKALIEKSAAKKRGLTSKSNTTFRKSNTPYKQTKVKSYTSNNPSDGGCSLCQLAELNFYGHNGDHVNAENSNNYKRQHHRISNNNYNIELNDRFRLESIKKQILTKLGLTQKPNVSHPLPKQFIWDTIYRADGSMGINNAFSADFEFGDGRSHVEAQDTRHANAEQYRLFSAITTTTTTKGTSDGFPSATTIPKSMLMSVKANKNSNQYKKSNYNNNNNNNKKYSKHVFSRHGSNRYYIPYEDNFYNYTKDTQQQQQQPNNQAEHNQFEHHQHGTNHGNTNNINNNNKLKTNKESSHIIDIDRDSDNNNNNYNNHKNIASNNIGHENDYIYFNDYSALDDLAVLHNTHNYDYDHSDQHREYRTQSEFVGHPEYRKSNTQQQYHQKDNFEREEYFGNTQEIITFAERGSMYHQHRLLEFSAKKERALGQKWFIRSAQIHIHIDKQPSADRQVLQLNTKRKHRGGKKVRKKLKIWIFQLVASNNNTDQAFEQHVTRFCASFDVDGNSLGWQKFDMTEVVREWYGRAHIDKLRLLIDCSGCGNLYRLNLFQTDHRHGVRSATDAATEQPGMPPNLPNPNRPFLVMHTETNRLRRVRRRAVDCGGALNGQCCKESFYVSFKALGWDDWIIAPRGYFANYCRGDCTGPFRTPDTFQTFHAHFIEEYRKMGLLNGMKPCCAPVKFSSMSLIYYGDDGIIKRDLPKMVVDECGCP